MRPNVMRPSVIESRVTELVSILAERGRRALADALCDEPPEILRALCDELGRAWRASLQAAAEVKEQIDELVRAIDAHAKGSN